MKEVEIGKDGNLTVNIEAIKRIAIESITDVLEHRIAVEGGITVHELEFINHGYCKAAYNHEHKLIEFITQHMACKLTPENVLVLQKSPESDPE